MAWLNYRLCYRHYGYEAEYLRLHVSNAPDAEINNYLDTTEAKLDSILQHLIQSNPSGTVRRWSPQNRCFEWWVETCVNPDGF